MPWVGFEPTISAGERPKTYALDRAATGIGRASPYRAVNTFHLGYKNQSVYAVSGTSRCLFSDKYKT